MDTWRYESASDLDQPMIERLRRFPREPDMLVYGLRSLAALTVRGWLKLYHRFEVVGRENLPAAGSFVMVANHSSHLDSLCLLSALPLRKLHRAFPAAARDYFFISTPRALLAAIVVNALPFERQVDIRQSLELCRHLLANPGNIMILFPEGTRSPDGALGRFRAGIGWLLEGTNVPVVPCRLDGCFNAMPKGVAWPRPCRIKLTIGPARTYSDARPQVIADDLQETIRAMESRHDIN